MKLKNLTKTIALIATATITLTACSTGSNNESTASQWDTIKEKGVITVGIEGNYSPFNYHNDDGDLVGYDVEVAEQIADYLGIDVEFVETEFDGLIAGVDAEKYDVVINQVGITDERKEKYLFSEPYTYSYACVLTTNENTDITSFEDLNGKSTAQTLNSNWQNIAESYGADVTTVDGFSQSIELVLQGRVDATVNDSVTYLDYKNKQPDSDLKIAVQSDDVVESAVLIRKNETSLQKKINKAKARAIEIRCCCPPDN